MRKCMKLVSVLVCTALMALCAIPALAVGTTVIIGDADREIVIFDTLTEANTTPVADWTGGGLVFENGELVQKNGWMGWGDSTGSTSTGGIDTADWDVEYLVVALTNKTGTTACIGLRFTNSADQSVRWEAESANGVMLYDGTTLTNVDIQQQDVENFYFELPGNFDGYMIAPVSGIANWNKTVKAFGFLSVLGDESMLVAFHGIGGIYAADQGTSEPEPHQETADVSVIAFAIAAITGFGALALVKRKG